MKLPADDLMSVDPYVRDTRGAWVTDDIPHSAGYFARTPADDGSPEDERKETIGTQHACAPVDAAPVIPVYVPRAVVAVQRRIRSAIQRPQFAAGTTRQMGGVMMTNRYFVRRQFG